ncbi:MAG: V4R domain-containing protein [Acidobacteriota bacterium]
MQRLRQGDSQPIYELVDLPTLLQQKAEQRRTGRLRVVGPDEAYVDFFFDTRTIVYVSLNGHAVERERLIGTLAAIFRWRRWNPELADGVAPPVRRADRLDEPLAGLLLRVAVAEDERMLEPGDDALAAPSERWLPSDVDREVQQALRQIVELEEVTGWMLCSESGEILTAEGLEASTEDVAASVLRLAQVASRTAQTLRLGRLCHATSVLDGFALLVLPVTSRYLGLRLAAGVPAHWIAERAEVLLGIRSEAALASGHATAMMALQAQPSAAPEGAGDIAAVLQPLSDRQDVGGLLVSTGGGPCPFTSLPARPETLAALGDDFERTFRELGTVWSDVGDVAFVCDQDSQLLLKNLAGTGTLAILCLSGVNLNLLNMPANVAAHELTDILAAGPTIEAGGSTVFGSTVFGPTVDSEAIALAAERIAVSYPDIVGAVRRFESALPAGHDRAESLQVLGLRLAETLVDRALLPRRVLRAIRRVKTLPRALKSVVWPILRRFTWDMGGVGRTSLSLKANAFCGLHQGASEPHGWFVRGLILGLLGKTNLPQVAIEETLCQATGDRRCLFEVTPC